MRFIASRENLQNIDLKSPATWIATFGGSGLLRPAPGTMGSIAALPFGILTLYFFGIYGLLIATFLLFIIGLWASKQFEGMVNQKDSSLIVVDEAVGIFIALIPAMISPISIILAFFAFRFFDVLKPWPISYLDKKLKGPFGVMIDDVVAGIFAAFIVLGARYAGFS
ncbi:MAG: phosphatidylglycerophosphatase A [Pseudomonadota bacterium]